MIEPALQIGTAGDIGSTIGSLTGASMAVLGGAVGAFIWVKSKLAKAKLSDAEGAVAVSQETLYNQMTQRMEAMEIDLRGIREELRQERESNRRLAIKNERMELHIIRLENMLRDAGMQVPALREEHIP